MIGALCQHASFSSFPTHFPSPGPHLLVLAALGHGTVLLGFLEEDLLHLAVLQVVQLPHCILGSCDQVHDHGLWTLAAQEAMLRVEGGDER